MDTATLIKAIGIGLLAGLLVAGLISLRSNKGKRSFLPITLVVTVIATIIIYFAWPSLTVVPDLNGLTQQEALSLIEKQKLVAEFDSLITTKTKSGMVIEGSQTPEAGTNVPQKSTVSFTVSSSFENYVKFIAPTPDSKVKCEILPSNFGRVYVSAIIRIAPEQMPLLWIRGVNPSTPEWYLQKYPFGLSISPEKDFWTGHAQIGNPEYPPQDDYIFDFAIGIVDRAEGEEWLEEPGAFSSPNPLGSSITIVNGVVMATEPQ
jgi:hypothetical protein